MPPNRKKSRKISKMKKTRRVRSKSNPIDIIKKDRQSLSDIERELLCYICNESFDSNEEFKNHIADCKDSNKHLTFDPNREYINKNRLKCEECHKIFKFKTNLLNHRKLEHSKSPGSVSCSQCHVRCPTKKILAAHVNEYHNRLEYECEHCGKRFARRSHVLRHVSQMGCDGSNIAVYPCDICGSEFSRKDNLIVHLRHQHILKNFYTCKHCALYKTRNFSKLIKHWQEKHLHPAKFECDICGSSTSSRTSIAKHLEIHGAKKYACDVCGYKTFTSEVIKRHVLTHMQEKPHKCEICGSSFIQRKQLLCHIQKHTGNICNKCGQSFNSKARLIIHERTHLGLERLVCPFDDCVFSKKEFSSDSALHIHVQGHLNKKEVKCEVCSKGFTSEVNMRRHLSIHRLDRPRRCMYCMAARAYIRGEQLLRHVRRHHPDIFHQHLTHVRRVLGTDINVDRVKKSELESILNVLDAESDRIIEGYGGSNVLYGGVQEQDSPNPKFEEVVVKNEENPLMSENELVESLHRLLTQLIDKEMLECFGWPNETVDNVLAKVIEHCGVRGGGADRAHWSRVQVLRENAKHLFLYAVEDKVVARMLDTHTIDQVIKHILAQVDDTDDGDVDDS